MGSFSTLVTWVVCALGIKILEFVTVKDKSKKKLQFNLFLKVHRDETTQFSIADSKNSLHSAFLAKSWMRRLIMLT